MDKVTTSLMPEDLYSKINSLQYIIHNIIDNTVKTIMIVKVVAVNGERIDVESVIQDLSNDGQPIGNFTIPSVRYLKWQYGGNCIDITPVVGDIGLLLVSKQDTSGLVKDGESVVQTGGIFNLGNGIYIGGLFGMNQEPTQFLHFEDNKVDITGTGEITINAPKVSINTEEAVIDTTTATVNATAVNLGGEGGKAVARAGDNVVSGTTVIGQIQAGSSKVFAVD